MRQPHLLPSAGVSHFTQEHQWWWRLLRPLLISAYFHLVAANIWSQSLHLECTEQLAPPFPIPHPKFLRSRRAPKVLSWKKKFVHFNPMEVAWERLDLQILPIPQHSPNSRGPSLPCQCPNQRTRDFSLCITTEVGPVKDF